MTRPPPFRGKILKEVNFMQRESTGSTAPKPEMKTESGIPWRKANSWFLVIWLIMFMDYMDRSAINAVLPLLKKEFLFTDTQTGVISSCLNVTVGLLALPVAIIVDRWSRTRMISVMVFIWSLATWGTSLANRYIHFVIARLGVGVGEAGYNAAGYALISYYYPKKVRGTMLGIFNTGITLGYGLGMVIVGWLAHTYGWRTCFGILAIPGILLALLVWFAPDYKTDSERGGNGKGKASVWADLKYVFKTPVLLYIYLGSAAFHLAYQATGTFGVTFLVREFGLNIKQAAGLLGMIGLLTFLGSPVGGWLGDRFLKKTEKSRLIVAASFATLVVIAGTISLQNAAGHLGDKSLTFTLIFWAIGGFFMAGVTPNLIGVTQEVVPTFLRATAAGFLPVVNNLLGSFPGPIIVGAISDRTNLITAMQIVLVVSAGLTVVFVYIATRYYAKAAAKLGSE
ncbi:MAG: MFS transporter [Deltaproteobacteria bacterium]|nr:MFS transporter [Deltaproteobacteria bacterium]